MAYDEVRGTAVLFGGGPGSEDETWEWDGMHWRNVAHLQLFLFGSAMAYDATRQVCVLFGGVDGDGFGTSDTWFWDGVSWTRAATSGPPPRSSHAMAYDTNREVVVLFGGVDLNSVALGDTWEWNGTEWTLASTSGPDPRFRHNMTFDRRRGVSVMHGGYVLNGARNDTWEWDGVEWTHVGYGPARSSFGFAYDRARGGSVLYGGAQGATRRGDTWSWNGSEWTQIADGGPRSRNAHQMVYDNARQVLLMHGGLVGPGQGSEETWYYGCPPPIAATVDASCPEAGRIRIEWNAATPDGNCALLFSRREGQMVIPPDRPCAGVAIGLDMNVHVVTLLSTDGNGMGSISGVTAAGACGGYLQLLDLANCRTSNVARIE